MLLNHLKDRRLDTSIYSGVWLDEENEVATFGIWNLSGQLVGFQQYRHLADKGRKPKPSDMRYFNIAGKEGVGSKLLAFGVELLDIKQKTLFIVEGIFDVAPLHNRGVNALAVMTNNPTHLKSWLHSLGYHIVALCEGDKAGRQLATVADEAIYLPTGKDPADMSDEWFDNIVKIYD